MILIANTSRMKVSGVTISLTCSEPIVFSLLVILPYGKDVLVLN
jgi:hypothetical protein